MPDFDEYGVPIKKKPTVQSNVSVDEFNIPIKKKESDITSNTSLNGLEAVLNPASQFGSIKTATGVTIPVDANKIPTPYNTGDYIQQAQERINQGLALPEDVKAISMGSGKKPEAVNAYLNGDNRTGQAVDRVQSIDENRQKLTGIIQDYNLKNNGTVNPEDLLNDPDKLSSWIQEYQTKLNTNISSNSSAGFFDPMSRAVDPSIKSRSTELLNQFVINQKPSLDNHITETTVEQDLKNGVNPDITTQKIAKRLNPVGYKNAQKALATKTGDNALSDMASVGELIGGIKDAIAGTSEKEDILKSVVGLADIKRNDAIQKLATDNYALAVLNNDENAMTNAKQLFQQYDANIIKKYPSIQMQQMAAEISRDVANDAGNLEGGDEFNGSSRNAAVSLLGETNAGYVQRMKDKGWFDDPDKKDLAYKLAQNPSLFSDQSYIGNAASSFVQPFKDLGYSIADIAGIRNKKDVISDKMKDELFPATTPDLINQGVRTVLNTTANLAGMVAIGAATGGIARAAGLGLTALETTELATEGIAAGRRAELIAKIGSTNSTIETLSNAASFGLPSVDANLKDSYNFIDSDAARATFAGMGAILNTYGGKLLNLPKLSAVKGLESDFAKVAVGLTDNSITQDAAAELLNEGKNKYVDFAVKYGKGVTEGAATMAYFTATNQILKSAFGDTETNSDDILNNTGHAFLDGVLGMMVFGAVKPIQEFNENKNSTYKSTLYNMALTPDATEDIFKLGKKSDEDFNSKMQILNTAVLAKNNLDAISSERNLDLSQEQKAVWISNKTTESYIRKQAESAPEGKRTELEARADKLKAQADAVLNGLNFTETLEPKTGQFEAEKEYNDAVQTGELPKIEAAKIKLDEETDKASVTPAMQRENTISVNEVIDKPVVYKGQDGHIELDGKTVLFKVAGQEKEYEIGNVDEIGRTSIKDHGIEQNNSVVSTHDNGNIVVRGKEYVNHFSDPLAAINRNSKGEIVSVNMETPEGKKVTFRNNIAEDVAYQIHLKEINKSNETRGQFEQFAGEQQPAEKIDTGTNKEVAKEEATGTNAEIPNVNNQEAATKLVEPLLGKGVLTGVEKPEDALKLIAEQAQGVSNGEDTSIGSDGKAIDSRDATERSLGENGKAIVAAAIELHPKESLITKELPSPKLEEVVAKSDIKFREPEDALRILKENIPEGKSNERVETTDIYGEQTGLKRAKDVQRNLQKEHKLLDMLINCLTK